MLKDNLIAYKSIFQADANNANFIASKVNSIIIELDNALNGKSINQQQFYQALNYNNKYLGRSNFNSAQINEKNLTTYLKFNFVLNQLKIHKTETNLEVIKFLKFLKQYQDESLTPGILKYKNNLLLIENPATTKQTLTELLTSLTSLCQDEINLDRQQKIKQQLDNADQKYSVTQLLGKNFTEQTKNSLSQNFSALNQNDEFKFIKQLNDLIKKNSLNYRDIAMLKISSQQFEKSVLKLKPINEITRFSWLINIICNFLNIFGNCFESNKSLKIKQNFKFWHRCLKISEQNIDRIESEISNKR